MSVEQEDPGPPLNSERWRKQEAKKIAAAVEELRKNSNELADNLEGLDLKEEPAASAVIAHLRPMEVARMALDIRLAVDHIRRARQGELPREGDSPPRGPLARPVNRES